jgi:DNA polymerase-3 subunit gamma/tau
VAHQSLYRTYRPQRFEDVVGQSHVTRTLRNAVAENSVSHAYLFTGPRGTGKTTTARILPRR